jgi:ankyrin repeat protein
MFDAVKTVLTFGLDVNAADGDGQTTLHAAAGYGFNSVVQLLADAGANLSPKDKRGITPLRLSTGLQQTGATNFARKLGNHPQTAELLRRLGAVE